MAKQKRDIYQEVTDQILTLMREHGADWLKPWTANGGGMPTNAVTGKAYSGTNTLVLALTAGSKGYSGNVWATYKQWQSIGANVRKGERGTMGIYFNQIEVTDEKTDEQKRIPIIRAFSLFNADQVEGYTVEKPDRAPFDVHETAERWIANTGAAISHGGDVACFIPSQDAIRMPERESFISADAYYSTAFHELTHWTGAKDRLDRIKHSRFGDSAYALEELVAELGAAFQCALTGVTDEPRPDHAKYINNWIRALEHDKKAFVSAASAAQKAVDLIESYQGEGKAEKAA